MNDYKLRTRNPLLHVSKILLEEISSKFTRVVTTMVDDVTPFVNLWKSETTLLNRQLRRIFKDVKELYRRNEEFLGSLGKEFEDTATFLR